MSSSTADPRAKTVLIVDDDEGVNNLLEVLVSGAGFKTITAGTGEQAIEKLALKPDAVLLDLIMPGCGGLGFLKHLKKVPGPLPPVLVFSAYENRHPSVLEAVMDPHVTQFFSKPINQDVLMRALHHCLKTRPLPAEGLAKEASNPSPASSEHGIEGNAFFEGFKPESKVKLIESARMEIVSEATALFSEGDAADCVYLVCRGQVELVKKADGNHSVVLAAVEAGDFFGELGVLDNSGRNVGARTNGAATLAKIPCAAVRKVLETESSEAWTQLLKRTLHYLRVTNERVMAEIVHKEKIQLIGEMASSIIHDFRNPLTSIQLAAHMIVGKYQDEMSVHCCKVIVQQADRMVGMAQELLEFSQGKPKLEMKKMSVGVLFETFKQLNEEYLKEANVLLIIAAAEAEINVDLDRFLRVLQNLVGNAVDAIRGAGDQGGNIFLGARLEGGMVDVQIRDDGPGIPEGIRSQIFQPFFTFGKKHGTGLGMSIAKTLVEAHGGDISFVSEIGKGTTFHIKLPRA